MGMVPPASVLPPDHQLGMQVPKGGSMCANCQFLKDPQTCGNQGFITWNGTGTLPAPSDEYCCDLYQPAQSQNQNQAPPQGNAGLMVKALQG